MALQMSQEFMERIFEHARRAYPEECCGFLGGPLGQDGAKAVQEIIPAENARAESRQTRYVIHPDEFRKIEQGLAAKGWGVLGFYHSHPDHPAQPSQYDREHAWPWYSYLVVGVRQGKVERATSWVLREDRSIFDEEPIEVKSSSPLLRSSEGAQKSQKAKVKSVEGER